MTQKSQSIFIIDTCITNVLHSPSLVLSLPLVGSLSRRKIPDKPE
jgi:hypothetical protein